MSAVRQGDVLIIKCDKIPATAKRVDAENGRLIVQPGEATGHNHSFHHRRGIALFRDEGAGGDLYIKADVPSALEHQEHSALLIEPGTHRVVIQRTFSAGLVRRVHD